MTEWRKSSHSQDDMACVEVAMAWRTPCGPGECVEIADTAGAVHVRDSKDPTGPVLTFTTAEWAAFVAALKAGTL